MPVLMDLKATEARVEMAEMVLRRAPQVWMAVMVAMVALVVVQRLALLGMAATEALAAVGLMESMAWQGPVRMD